MARFSGATTGGLIVADAPMGAHLHCDRAAGGIGLAGRPTRKLDDGPLRPMAGGAGGSIGWVDPARGHGEFRRSALLCRGDAKPARGRTGDDGGAVGGR